MALAPRSVGAASGTDAGRCLAGSLGAARLPTWFVELPQIT